MPAIDSSSESNATTREPTCIPKLLRGQEQYYLELYTDITSMEIVFGIVHMIPAFQITP